MTARSAAPDPLAYDDPRLCAARAGAPALRTPIGLDPHGEVVQLDLWSSSPHAIIAGMSGSGKSTVIHTVLCDLITRNTPEAFQVGIADAKQVTGALYRKQPHLWRPVATTGAAFVELLQDASNEIRGRYTRFAAEYVPNLTAWNRRHPEERLPALLIVIDELETFCHEAPEIAEAYAHSAGDIARLGRAAGVALLITTQRPAVGLISPQVIGQISSRVVLRQRKPAEARIMLGEIGRDAIEEILAMPAGSGFVGDYYAASYEQMTFAYLADWSDDEDELTVERVLARVGPTAPAVTPIPAVTYGVSGDRTERIAGSPWRADGSPSITTVVGMPGSGKSFWVGGLAERIARAGEQVITVDPLDGLRLDGAIAVDVDSRDGLRINPFARPRLGSNVDPSDFARMTALAFLTLVPGVNAADRFVMEILTSALGAFYASWPDEEQPLFGDFVAFFRTFGEDTLWAGARAERDRVAALLEVALAGELNERFGQPDGSIPTDLRIAVKLRGGRSMADRGLVAFAGLLAAIRISLARPGRTLLVIDELLELITLGGPAAARLLADFVRIHRHLDVAPVFVTQFFDTGVMDPAVQRIVLSTTEWVVFALTEPMAAQARDLLGDVCRGVELPAGDHGRSRHAARPAVRIRWADGGPEATPFLAVAVD